MDIRELNIQSTEEREYTEYLISISDNILQTYGLEMEELDYYPNQKTGKMEVIYKISHKDEKLNELNEEMNGEWICSGLENLTNQLIGFDKSRELIELQIFSDLGIDDEL